MWMCGSKIRTAAPPAVSRDLNSIISVWLACARLCSVWSHHASNEPLSRPAAGRTTEQVQEATLAEDRDAGPGSTVDSVAVAPVVVRPDNGRDPRRGRTVRGWLPGRVDVG